MRRTISVLVVPLVALLWLATPATATPPARWSQQVVNEFQPTGVACEGFEIFYSDVSDERWTVFHDSAGIDTVWTVHFSFTGTLYNSTDRAKSLPYEGRGYWTYDFRDGRGVDTYRYTAVIDGKRVVFLAAQDMYWPDGSFAIHGIFGWSSIICPALS
jgi:hypothetical protein